MTIRCATLPWAYDDLTFMLMDASDWGVVRLPTPPYRYDADILAAGLLSMSEHHRRGVL